MDTKNDIDATFCTSCGLNIYGFSSEQVSKINSFKRKVEALNNLIAQLNNKNAVNVLIVSDKN